MRERVLQDPSEKYSAGAKINALNFLDLVKFLRYRSLLRANFKNRHFARNRGLHFTGRFQKSPFCP